MKLAYYILFVFTFLWGEGAVGQNLVPNWSFELIDSCPPGHTMFINNDWYVQNWNTPPGSVTTPDLFSTCYNGTVPIPPYEIVSVPSNFMGIAHPKTGNNYMGVLLKYGTTTGSENLQVQLSSPLSAGQTYLCGFHVQRSDSSYYQIDKVGMHISDIEEWQTQNQNMFLNPQIENTTGIIYDSLNWLKVEDLYVASGGEEYVTIGNFYGNADMQIDSVDVQLDGNPGWFWGPGAYYLIDDVYIIPYSENLQVNFNDTLCLGETYTLSATGSAKYDWYISGDWFSNDTVISIDANEDIQISVVGYEDSLSHFVKVIDCPLDCSGEPIIPNVFTPNGDNINDLFHPGNIDIGCYTITVLNRWGNLIYKADKSVGIWDGTAENGEPVNDGVYFCILEVEDNLGTKTEYYGHITVSR